MSETEVMAVEPSKSLTIKASRLAGSDRCLNCSTELQGPFCHYCGQPDKRLLRFFPVLIREFFEDFLELDSRFTRTMKPLLFQPGRMTRDYLDGRRFRFTPPMRLFIFSSMLFFILAATLASNAIEVGDVRFDGDDNIQLNTTLDQEELAEAIESGDADRIQEVVEKARQEAEAAQQEQAEESSEAGESAEEEEEPRRRDFNLNLNGEQWDRETNPVILPLVPDSINDWINDEIENSPQKAEEIEQNPDIIVDKVFELLPATMFIMLPFVALLFKFWYMFAKKYYVEHLIHALHNHAFLFVVFIITLLNNALIGWQDPQGISAFWQSLTWINTAIYIWIPVYLFISLRTVYQQNWFLTILKFGAIGISYFALLTFVTTFVAMLSFLLL
jgi:hypothetical protein